MRSMVRDNNKYVGAIHSTKISGNFGPKLNGSVRSNRKSFEKTGPPFEGRDPFNQNSNRSDREKRTTSKGGPVFSKLFWLDRTDPLSFGPKFPEILVEWIAPEVVLFSRSDRLELWLNGSRPVIHWPGGPYWEKLCPRPRAALETEGTVFPNND